MEKVKAMKIAARHVDSILKHLVPLWLHEGVTEKEVTDKLENAIRDNDRFGLSFDAIVAFGANAVNHHHVGSDTQLQKGDTVLIDCGATYDGWCSDCTRMFSLGTPSSEFLHYFNLLKKVHLNTIPRYHKGTMCRELGDQARQELGEAGKYFNHSLGHGVAKEVHAHPFFGSMSQEILLAGDVVTCEPGIYIEGKFGIRIEDQLLITHGAPELITTLPCDLIIV